MSVVTRPLTRGNGERHGELEAIANGNRQPLPRTSWTDSYCLAPPGDSAP